MSDIITLCPVKQEPRVDSRTLAEYLDIQHKNVIAQIDNHKLRFEKFGKISFKTRKSKRGIPERYALLAEDQAYLLLTFSKNTDRVADLKVELVAAFSRFRQNQQTDADYLPFYHDFHDEIKLLAEKAHQSGSKADASVFHSNFNKLINKSFGIKSGQRQKLSGPLRAKVTAAHVITKEIIKKSIEYGISHKDAYQQAKLAIMVLANTDKELARAK